MIRTLLCTAAVISLLASCTRKKTVVCEDMHYVLNTVGYTLADVDTLELRWFERGSGFAKPLDTLVMRNRPDYMVKGDTIRLAEQSFQGLPPKGGRTWTYHHDVEVYFPAVSRRYRISNIEHSNRYTMETEGMNDIGCINNIVAYTLDSTKRTWGAEAPNIYLKK